MYIALERTTGVIYSFHYHYILTSTHGSTVSPVPRGTFQVLIDATKITNIWPQQHNLFLEWANLENALWLMWSQCLSAARKLEGLG